MKLAVVVQRYGGEIPEGSEYHCRLVAERLAARHQIEVLTTCARDSATWKNECPEGEDRIRGVTVRRFANELTRDPGSFSEYSNWIVQHDHAPAEEAEWLKRQGPWSPALLSYLTQHHRSYDALIFFDYRYAPTVEGLRVDPARSILVPAAQDEPALGLGLYRDLFSAPAGIAYNTHVERGVVTQRFKTTSTVEDIIGCGVDLPPARRPGVSAAARDDAGDPASLAASASNALESPPTSRGAVFRRRHRLFGPLVLYEGRIDPGKGCEELLDYFHSFADADGNASLVLMGMKLMPIPELPHIRFAGMLSESERFDAFEAATVVAVPSPCDSLSLPALESFAAGTPVLANARSDVLTDHCQRSNGGLYYGGRDEFRECLRLLIDDASLRAALGRQGRDYVRANYRWDVIMGKYDRLVARVQRPRGSGRGRRGGRRRGGNT